MRSTAGGPGVENKDLWAIKLRLTVACLRRCASP
jgi:hypothetical protein